MIQPTLFPSPFWTINDHLAVILIVPVEMTVLTAETPAQGVVLGSPVYFMDVTSEMKALIDRVGFVSRSNGGIFGNKIGSLVAAARRAGAVHTLDTMSHFFLSMEMIIVGRAIGVGRDEGDVERDKEGLMLVNALGQRMAWLLKKLYG